MKMGLLGAFLSSTMKPRTIITSYHTYGSRHSWQSHHLHSGHHGRQSYIPQLWIDGLMLFNCCPPFHIPQGKEAMMIYSLSGCIHQTKRGLMKITVYHFQIGSYMVLKKSNVSLLLVYGLSGCVHQTKRGLHTTTTEGALPCDLSKIK